MSKLVHYTLENGNNQQQLQNLASDILTYGKRVAECRHTSHEVHPNGDERRIEAGTSCIEVINELNGNRYWVHLSGCRVTEIIEAYKPT